MYTGGHRYVEVECRYLKKALKNPFKALILKRFSTTFKALSNAK
jgi:hypothetical protein